MGGSNQMGVAATTRAAEGLPRRAFTVREVVRMQHRGIIHPDEKFELVEGEIVPMQAKSPVHELIKETLTRDLLRVLPEHLWLGIERTLFLSEQTALDPDLMIFPAALKVQRLTGPDALLVIEVAASSLRYDRGLKASLYARFGVRDYWVIDASLRTTVMHREPQTDGSWAECATRDADEILSHPAIPGWATRLSAV
jgi:Uma2 family endonuclease